MHPYETHEPTPRANAEGKGMPETPPADLQNLAESPPPAVAHHPNQCVLGLSRHVGPLKVLADVCSIGKSTLRKYLCQFAHSIIAELKPKYMPCKPWSGRMRSARPCKINSRRVAACVP